MAGITDIISLGLSIPGKADQLRAALAGAEVGQAQRMAPLEEENIRNLMRLRDAQAQALLGDLEAAQQPFDVGPFAEAAGLDLEEAALLAPGAARMAQLGTGKLTEAKQGRFVELLEMLSMFAGEAKSGSQNPLGIDSVTLIEAANALREGDTERSNRLITEALRDFDFGADDMTKLLRGTKFGAEPVDIRDALTAPDITARQFGVRPGDFARLLREPGVLEYFAELLEGKPVSSRVLNGHERVVPSPARIGTGPGEIPFLPPR